MKATPTIQQITPLYVYEREWFKKKCERDIGEFHTRKETQITDIEKCLKLQELFKCSKEIRMYREFIEPPRPDNVPDVVWGGPLMTRCGCPKNDCQCQGNILLPPKHISCVTRYTWRPLYYLRALTCFKKWQPPEPQKTFAQRLKEAVDDETDAYKKLKEMGVLEKRGPEFCINRCFFYQIPEAKSDNEYFTLKHQILEEYKNKVLQPVMDIEIPVEEEDVQIVDGFYRTLSTQSNVGPHGEFIMGKISHILFAKMDDSTLYDLEGKKLYLRSYKEIDGIPKLPTSNGLVNLFSLKGIKSQFSKLTNKFLSSIIEIKDTGIPVHSQSTQDPPLDNTYQSVIEIPLKGLLNLKDGHGAEMCPCCEFYKTATIVTSNFVEQNTAKDDFKNNESDSEIDPELICPKKNNIFSVAKSEKTLGVITENNILSSSPQDSPRHDVSQTNKYTENEVFNRQSSKVIEENENYNNKLSTLPQAEEVKNKIVERSEHNNDNKNDKIRNNISSIDQTNKVSNNVNNLDNYDTIVSSHDFNIDDSKFNENNLSKNLLTEITNNNTERNIKEDLANTEKEPIKQVADQIISDLNGKSSNTLNKNDISSIHTSKNVAQRTESSNLSSSKNQNNFESIKANRSNISFRERHTANSSKTDVNLLLNSNVPLNFNSSQKPSLKNFASKNTQRVELRSRVKKALSYDDLKLRIKKSFQKTSSALSEFFKCLDFSSSLSIRHSKHQNNNKELLQEENVDNNINDDFIKVLGNSDKKDSKISEKEVFSLQYNSNLMTDTESTAVNGVASEVKKIV